MEVKKCIKVKIEVDKVDWKCKVEEVKVVCEGWVFEVEVVLVLVLVLVV